METVLDGLGEPNSLSPLSTAVHDEEDFPSLGGPPGGPIVEAHIHSDGDEALDPTCGGDHVDVENASSIVASTIPVDDDDPIGLGVSASSDSLSHVDGLEAVVAETSSEPGTSLGEEVAEELEGAGSKVMETSILGADSHLVHAAEQEGILLASDPDGNLAMPVSTDQVIRFLMQTSDGNVMAADAQVEAIKFSMPGLMSSSEAGDVASQTVQAVTLPDGTTTFFQTPKEENVTEGQSLTKITESQAIKLEDGTTALLQPAARGIINENLHAIQLDDGTTAFITPGADVLFDPNSLNIEQFTNQSMLGVSEKTGEKALVIGDKAYKCMYEDCGRLYTTLHHLKVHERSHTGDRPFICDYQGCGKAFATGYGLKSHNRVHTGEKPYPCQEVGCEKAFKTSGDLQKHVRTHTGERPFRCPFEGCTRSFTTSNIRKVHIRTHTGERPYICDVEGCGRAFASATNYKNHIRIHTGEKPYVCTVLGCGKAFTEYSSLYKHHVVHTPTKPYTCCYCGKTYRQTSTLAMHKRSAHGEDLPVEGTAENTSTSSDTPEQHHAKKIKTETSVQSTDSLSQPQTDASSQVVLLTSQVNNTVTTSSGSDSDQQLASLVTLQSQTGTISLQDLQQSGLPGLANFNVGENSQVLVVTPSQLEALQQLAAQQIDTLNQVSESSSLSRGDQGGANAMSDSILPH